jgi:hypothetical protein
MGKERERRGVVSSRPRRIEAMTHLHKGDEVTWRWGAHTAEGRIGQTFTAPVKRKIKGSTITRNASKTEPAYLVTQADGGKALKSASELQVKRRR